MDFLLEGAETFARPGLAGTGRDSAGPVQRCLRSPRRCVGHNAPAGHAAGCSVNVSLAHSGLCLAKLVGAAVHL